MTILTVVPENGIVEDVLAARYRAAFNKTKAGREQWIEGTLELVVVLKEARKRFPADQDYSRWIVRNNLQHISKNDRSALNCFGKDLTYARQLLGQSDSISWERIWRTRSDKSPARVPLARNPRPNTPPPSSPRRASRPSSRRRYKPTIPDVMREDNEGIEWTRAAAQPLPPPRDFGILKGLTPEQVDPDFKGTRLEFATLYGHVNLHTKEQLDHNKKQEALAIAHSAIADHERTGRVMVAALAKVDSETLAAWLRKPGKCEKLQGWVDSIQRAYDVLQSLTNKRNLSK